MTDTRAYAVNMPATRREVCSICKLRDAEWSDIGAGGRFTLYCDECKEASTRIIWHKLPKRTHDKGVSV